LEHEPDACSGDLFKDQAEVLVGSEQGVNLGADTLDRR
jgi:hypothetical protein